VWVCTTPKRTIFIISAFSDFHGITCSRHKNFQQYTGDIPVQLAHLLHESTFSPYLHISACDPGDRNVTRQSAVGVAFPISAPTYIALRLTSPRSILNAVLATLATANCLLCCTARYPFLLVPAGANLDAWSIATSGEGNWNLA
jgi:hypothetical protein